MPRGGKRKGTGRPKSSGENREPTKTVRVPLSFAEKIPELLKKHQEENSFEDLQLPAKVHEECLPLEGLAWDAFESFCLDLVARFLKPQEIYHYGTQGNNQEGVDIVAHLNNGEKWAFQCKQWQRFNLSDATKVIERAKGFEADRYILLLSRAASVEVRKVLANSPKWEVWDVRDISQKVRELANFSPEVARRLVRDHFHPEWQNAFLGISKLTPFISPEDFFHPWLNTNPLFNHSWKLEGRDDVLKSLHEFVISSEKKVAILPGRGGIGKSKLLHEFAKTFEHSHFRLWFVEDDIPITPENADNLPLHPCVIVLDDAHRREQDVITLCNLIHNRLRNKHPEIKLVLSSRPQAGQSLQMQLDRKGIDYWKLNELKELSRPEMKALARQALGQDYAHFADQLAVIAHDSPLVTVVGGRLLADQKIPPNLLERNEDFRCTVLSRFEDILIGQVSQQIEPELCRKILKLLAATAPIKLRNEQFQQAATEILGIDRVALRESIGTLEKAGVLLRRDDSLRITPDVLSDHILYKACLTDQGEFTGYAQKVFGQFKQICPAQILSNLAELDWRIQYKTGQETDLLSDVWQTIWKDFQSSSHHGRWKILGILETSAHIQPKQTLDIIKFAIRSPATLTKSEYTSFDDHEAVLKKVPALLHKISYNLDYIAECCDILWKLGKDRKSNQNSNSNDPIEILIDLAQYGLYKSSDFNQIVLDSVTYRFKQAKTPEHINLLLDILDPILQKDFDANYQEDWTMYFRKISVSREKTQKLRDQALKLITSCLKSDQVNVVLRALKSLGKALEEKTGALAPQTPEQFSQEWESEQLKIIEIITQFVSSNTNALLHLEISDILSWSVHHGCISAAREKARAVINLIPDTYELRLTKVLLQKYDWWARDEKDTENANQRYTQFTDEMPRQVAQEFLHRFPNADDGVQTLNKKLEEIQDSGLQARPYDLLKAIAEANLSYATSTCQLLIQQPDLLLTSHLTPLLSKIRLDNPDYAIELIQEAIYRENTDLLSAVARIYLGRDWAKQLCAQDLIFIEKLLNEPDLDIRCIAIMSLSELGYFHPQSALSLALSVNLESSEKLASELCQLFTSDPVINPDVLTDSHLEKLLSKLVSVKKIDDYWIESFLFYASKKVPDLVLKFLLNRIEKDTEDFAGEYQPLPCKALKYNFNLINDEKGREVLRAVRDFSLGKRYSVRFLLAEIFGAVFSSVTVLSLSILGEWIDSGESEKVEIVSLLLREMPQTFAFTQVEFLTNLLEQADILGDQCYEIVSENLFCAAINASRGGIIEEPCQEVVTSRDQSLAIASQLLIGSPAHKFYSSLAKYAEQISSGK